MTEREFRTSALRDDLKALLNQNQALRTALEIVGDTARPRGGVEPRPNAHLDTLVAQKYHKQAGIQSALDHLLRLAELPAAEVAEEDELEAQPFFNSLPEPMKTAMRQRQKENPTPA